MVDLADIRRLLDAFEASDWEEVHLVADGIDLYVSAGGAPAAAVTPPPPAAPEHSPAPASDPAAAVEAPPPTNVEVSPHGAHAVRSPSPGIFWRSPAPGEPPFVEVGQAVDPQTPIGIVEVMKLMSQVLAETRGTVRAVLVENGGHVDREQPLVLIEPDA